MARPALRVDAVLVQASHCRGAAPSPTCTTSPPLPDKTAGRPGLTRSRSTCSWSPPGGGCASDGPSRLAWCWFVIALVASLGANVATAGLLDLRQVPAWLRILVAAWPALAFIGRNAPRPLRHRPPRARSAGHFTRPRIGRLA
ncbi:hypothetical protein SALBM311S_01866 [Streptomyces alboniger]